MKHIYSPFKIVAAAATVLMCLFFYGNGFAQVGATYFPVVGNPNYGDSLDGFNESAFVHKAQEKGLNAYETGLYVRRCKRIYVNRKYNLNSSRIVNPTNPLVINGPCVNMDFEQGSFNGWTGYIGDNTVSSNGPLQNIVNGLFSTTNDALLSDCNARHTIMTLASGNDPCGGFPTVAPGGNYSCRLGEQCANYQGEEIEQTFLVNAGNTSFTYQYAVVLQDGGHSAGEQPYFSIEMDDQSNNLIPCSQYYVTSGGQIPGFLTSATCTPGVAYKPWTTVNVDLSTYVGQNVTIKFIAAGCIYAGHYGYAYVDASCLPYQITTNDSLCAGGTITLTAPAGAATYAWSPGGQTTQSINVSTAGSYSVTMTSVTGCTTTLTTNVGMYPQPIAAFTPNAGPCSATYTFGNTSSVSSGTLYYHWDFGDPATASDTSNIASPSYTYATAGTYTVTLIVYTASGCSDTLTQIVNPGNGGQAAFTSTTVCQGNATQFTDQSVGASAWDWNFGDPASGPSDSSQVQNPTHIFSGSGTYTVTLTAQTNPCPSVITNVITVNPPPTAAFVYNQVCGGQSANFTSTSTVSLPSTITSTSWNFGDPASGGNNTSTLSNPSHTFTNPGTYTVTITVTTNNGCTQTFNQTVTVGPPPVAAFVATTVCTNSAMQFTNQSLNTGTYHWDFGDLATLADTSNIVNPTYTYTVAGTYNVTLIANPGPCADTSVLAVTVAPGPQVQFVAPQVCLGSSSSFTDQSTIAQGNITAWSWNFGDPSTLADTSSTQNPNYTYNTAGTYTVTLTCTSNNGCTSTNTLTVTVNPLPIANFNSTVVCAGTPTNLQDLSVASTGTITSWNWNFGDNTPNSNVQNPVHTYANDTTYNVTLIVTNSAGCIDTVVLPVVTASIPNVVFTADTFAGCPQLCVNFMDQTTISSGSITGWTWNFGDNSPNSFAQNPSHCYSQTGTYTVTMTATSNGGCASTLTIPNMITVYPVPHASFTATPQTTTILNTNISFTDLSTGNPVMWQWNFGDPNTLADTSNIQNPTYQYSTDNGDTYPVNLIVTNQFGCVDDTSIDVIVEPEFTFFIPNAFTPNGDGINDFFFGTGIGITTYNIWIFDRWGNLIFTTNDINKGWDGTVQGKSGGICQEDVYVWKVVLTDIHDKKHKYIGHVSLIK